jgi:carbonic anhydrase/acetyltransferase-like protein (isoleucine patch superfamily)
MALKDDDDIHTPNSELTIVNGDLNSGEVKVAQLWSKLLRLGDQTIKQDSDFFELGGHSMVAARLVSALRAMPQYKDVTMIDVYKFQKLKQFSERLETLNQQSGYSSGSSSTIFESPIKSLDMNVLRPIPEGSPKLNPIMKWIFTFIALYLVFTFASMQLLVPYLMYSYVNIESFTSVAASQNETITISDLLLHPTEDPNYDTLQNIYGAIFDYSALSLMLVSLVLTWMVYPILCIIAKWVILGRAKPGVYPLYGLYYWRWWVVHRMMTMLPLSFFKGSPILVGFYRALGANIGKNVYMGTGHVSCLDMITIGDNTSVGIDVHIHGYTVKVGKPDAKGRCHGWLIIGPTDIGSDCYIGARTHLSIDTVVPNDTGLAEFSMVPENTVLESGRSYAGCPISPCKSHVLGNDFTNQLKDENEQFQAHVDPRRLPHWLVNIIHLVFLLCMMLIFMAALIPGSVSMVILINHPQFSYGITSVAADDGTTRTTSVYYLMAMTVLLVISFVVVLCLEIAAVKWILLGRSRATRKIFHVDSWLYARKWFVDCLLQLSLAMLHSLYATMFLPSW